MSEKRLAVVTGAARGIGRAVVLVRFVGDLRLGLQSYVSSGADGGQINHV